MEVRPGDVCAFCNCGVVNSRDDGGGREILERFRNEFIVPFIASIYGGNLSASGDEKVPGNWVVCGKCLPEVSGVLGSKEKVDLMEAEVRELQREILKGMNSLSKELEKMCEGMGVVWGMMGKEGELSQDGGSLRKKFRNQVGNVLLDLQNFREESTEKLLRRRPLSPSPPQKDASDVIEIDLISDAASISEELDVNLEDCNSSPLPNSPLDASPEDETYQEMSCDDQEEPEVLELDHDTDQNVDSQEEEDKGADNAASKKNPDKGGNVATSEENADECGDDATSEEDDSSEESSDDDQDSSSDEEPSPQKRQMQKFFTEKFCTMKNLPVQNPLLGKNSNVRQRLITKIAESQSIATSLNLPSSPVDDPRRNYAIQYNPESQTFHLSGIEIKCIDTKRALQCTACNIICGSLQNRLPEEIMFDHILGMHLKVYKCPQCVEPHFSRNHAYLLRHIEDAHRDRDNLLHTCDICGKPDMKTGAFKSHRWTHLSKEEREDPSNSHMMPSRCKVKRKKVPLKTSLCPYCGKELNKQYMYEHLKTHQDPAERKKKTCPTCGKDVYFRYYRQHTEKCSNRKERTGTPCIVCGELFQTRIIMFKHLRKAHPEERRFPCEICGMRFKTEPDMVTHRKLHTDERPKVCEMCGKGFKNQYGLTIHKKSCGVVKEIKRPDNSKIWEKKMQEPVELRPVPCDVCQRRFKTTRRMREHKAYVHNQETGEHSCGFCGKKFVHPANLRKHQVKCDGTRGRRKRKSGVVARN